MLTIDSGDRIAHTSRALDAILALPGYIDDVARRMVALAKLYGENKTIACRYCGIELHARMDSTTGQIRAYFEQQCRERPRPSLRLVA